MNRPALLLAIAVPALVAGCVSLGGNVKGNFVCRAPDGICAPTSKIDDQALAVMNAPAAPDALPATASTASPAQHSAGALQVVMPARTDRFGHWRDATVVYVEPDAPGPRLGGGTPPATAAPVRLSLVELAAGAPELAAFDQMVTSDGGRTVAASPVASIRTQVERTLGTPAAAATASASAPPPAPAPGSPPASPSAPVRAPAFPATSGEGGH
jgi:conjugal transfer pilus assembly protein TraV